MSKAKAPALATVPPPSDIGGQGARTTKAADGLAELVPAALGALQQVLTQERGQRHVSAKVNAAKYVLDIALDRVQPEAAAADAPARKLTPQEAMTELRKRLGGSNV